MADDDPDRNPIDVVVEEFAEKLRRGLSPSINEYIQKHPQYANEIREVLPAVLMMEQLKVQKKDKAVPERLGDCKILREIGRGGLGIVYEAEHKGLGRRVALKVIHLHALRDSTRFERFQREAQAVMRLHHTHIVPVFGIGESQGLNYFVMHYVPGRSLNEIVATLINPASETAPQNPAQPKIPAFGDPAYWCWVAQIGVQVAEALQYAHGQSIFHRDLKPSNILIDSDGSAWVADFGQSQIIDRDDTTLTGDNAGTIQYAAPEALHGNCDARSDVYSLSRTLHELLSLRLPFDNASPVDPEKIGDQKTSTRPAPRDLEAIVLKGCSRNPAERYQSAAEFAEALRRFLQNGPVAARQSAVGGGFWLWCRENRTTASLSVVVVAALLIALFAGWAGYARTAEALERETQRRKDAEDAKRRSDATLLQPPQPTQLQRPPPRDRHRRDGPPDRPPDGPPGPPPDDFRPNQ